MRRLAVIPRQACTGQRTSLISPATGAGAASSTTGGIVWRENMRADSDRNTLVESSACFAASVFGRGDPK